MNAIEKSARISECGQYRYTLSRHLTVKPQAEALTSKPEKT